MADVQPGKGKPKSEDPWSHSKQCETAEYML